jgi:hypothetical protein
MPTAIVNGSLDAVAAPESFAMYIEQFVTGLTFTILDPTSSRTVNSP